MTNEHKNLKITELLILAWVIVFIFSIFVFGINPDKNINTINQENPLCAKSLKCEYDCNNYLQTTENFNSCRYKCLTLKNCRVENNE